jgi:Bacterial protein of unknown function (DUF885)
MRLRGFWVAVLSAVSLVPGPSPQAAPGALGGSATFAELAQQWRTLPSPRVKNCVPDYGAAAMVEKAAALAAFRQRLGRLDRAGWPRSQLVDAQLIAAETNGMDFDLRVLRPWARDPSFYATISGEQSDVPAHEGATAQPVIDLFRYRYPLSPADQERLTCLIGAIPTLLSQARANLEGSHAHDLWAYGSRAFREQSDVLQQLEAGTLHMRTLHGTVLGTLSGVSDALRSAVASARAATDAFCDWVAAEAPRRIGPSGIGKTQYNWYEKNVHLVPYDWDAQFILLTRELERAQAGLRYEEFRNRDRPPLEPVANGDAFFALAQQRMRKLADFLIAGGLVPDKPAYRDALMLQVGSYPDTGQRNFFQHALVREPLGLYSHFYHWIELARLENEPPTSPVRRSAPLYNIFDTRSEGLATAMEEILMHSGLYDDLPRGREVVWVMLANRAARGLASLRVQANEMTLPEAGRFHAEWTPLGWSDPRSDLVAFEQLLYLRQPGYGTSYIVGKLQFDRLLADIAQARKMRGEPFAFPEFFRAVANEGILPFTLIEEELEVAAPG